MKSLLPATAVLGIATFLGVSVFAQGTPQIEDNGKAVSVKFNGQPAGLYRYVENPAKPYLERFYTPAGIQVLRDSPNDHKHHHGLMFAVAVDGVDFWSETPTCGRQKHQSGTEAEVSQRHGLTWVTGNGQFDWLAPDGKLVARETRTLSGTRLPEGPANLLVWQTKLESPQGKDSIKLSGSPYFGLGMRFLQSMDRGGQFFNADGKQGVAGTNNARSTWCAYAASVHGKPVTVAMFDLPGNPRHPATWFTMDQGFAYLSATLNLNKEPLVVPAGKPLVLRYAVALWDGTITPERVAKAAENINGWGSGQ